MARKNMAPAAETALLKEGELPELRLIFAAGFFLSGLYFEFCAALAAVLLFFWLWRHGKLSLRLNLASGAVAAIFLGYLLSCLWAADRGLAPLGIPRALAIALFALCLMQLSHSERRVLLGDLPLIGAGMTLICAPAQLVPVLAYYFSVSGRLAGFLQYPNSFALLQLLGLEVLLLGETEKNPLWLRIACAALLSLGLLLSGSRAVFLIALAALAACLLLFLFNKKDRPFRSVWPLLGAVAVGALLSIPAAALSPGAGGHLSELSVGASTFLGRLLYIKDALPIVLRQPFGLGYLGYYMTQRSFQHGVYAVRWIHCDPMQMLLDLGWLPAILGAAAMIRALRVRDGGPLRHVLLLTLLAHCLLDFDLQFASIFFVLLLTLDWEQGRSRVFAPRFSLKAAAAVLCAASLYLGLAAALGDFASPAQTLSVYPFHTRALLDELPEAQSAEEMESLADRILALDDKAALAWDAKARAYFARGDVEHAIIAKRHAMRCAPYDPTEYTDAFEMLCRCEELYRGAGDRRGAAVCLQEIYGLRVRIQSVLDSTDPLAWKIDDKPELTLPPGYDDYLAAHPVPAK